ncbi:MAG: amidophosphoribosyltransferase [Anaerolineae bacterium]|nr:amidophosphoribosyltransferase [Anaerolineae bacterium]
MKPCKGRSVSRGGGRPREACGVFGVCAGPGIDVARLAFFGLFALQHRGQESAGIAVSDGRRVALHKAMGLVSQVFTEENLAPLTGYLAIGHNRYSTSGSSRVQNAQPYVMETALGPLGVAHNGNLTNGLRLRRQLLERGVGLSASSDSEVITQLLAGAAGRTWEERIVHFMGQAEGAYSLTILTREAVYGVRDPHGFRPLCLGRLNGGADGWVLASESCALATIGAEFVREVRPGEVVRLDRGGVHAFQGAPPARRGALCVFEYIYFARPDSILEGRSVHSVRRRLGARLAREHPAEADLVIGVPDSATPAAIGYAAESGIPFGEGLIRNRYIGRTFIQPDERLRRMGVRLKFNPLQEALEGKRVVLLDDSIVRGTTSAPIVALVRQAGAREVHVRVSSPPIRHPCFMGVDMATREELIAATHSVEEIREHLGADSLGYLSLEGLLWAVGHPEVGHCLACFTGDYPVAPDSGLDKWAMEAPEAVHSARGG